MKITGKDYDIIWELRRHLAKERETGSSPLFYDYIALHSKTGEVIKVKEIEGLYAEDREIDSVAEWLKMSQHGPRSIRNIYGGNTDYESFDFTEPDLRLSRQIVNKNDVQITFIFDWREDKPDTFSIVTPESELIRAAEDYLEENKF
jgi:hypothetical protein